MKTTTNNQSFYNKITYQKMQKYCEIVNKLDLARYVLQYSSPFYLIESYKTILRNNFDIVEFQFDYQERIVGHTQSKRLVVPKSMQYFDKHYCKKYTTSHMYRVYKIYNKYYLLKLDLLTIGITFNLQYLWIFEYDQNLMSNIIRQFSVEETFEYLQALNNEFILSTI